MTIETLSRPPAAMAASNSAWNRPAVILCKRGLERGPGHEVGQAVAAEQVALAHRRRQFEQMRLDRDRLPGAAQGLGDQVARDRGGAAVGELGSRGVVGAELLEPAAVLVPDPRIR